MKIAFISDVIWPFTKGGSELRTYEIAKRLVKKGHQVHIYGAKLWEGQDDKEIDGIKIHGVSKYKILYDKEGRRSLIDTIKLSIILFLELRKEKFDIIDNISFVFFNCYSLKFLSLFNKTPLIFTWHQYFNDYLLGYMDTIRGTIGKIMEKQTTKFTKFNIASSKSVAKDLINTGVKENYTKVIYNGCDFKKIGEVKPFENKKYDLIFIGRMAYQKNLDLLLESLKHVKTHFPKIKICLIGDGFELDNLKVLSKSLGLEKNVEFLGEIEDRNLIYSYLKSSKIFVLPSRFEGFPLVVVEAAACGLPILIVSNQWNKGEDFFDKFCLKSNGTIEDFSLKILKLLKSNFKTNKIDKNMLNDFDWDIITDKTEEYYKRAISYCDFLYGLKPIAS